MKRKYTVSVLVGLVVLLTTIILFGTKKENAILQLVDTEILTEMMKSKEDILIIDVREEELFKSGRVPDSINIPFEQIKSRYRQLPADKKIVFVCHVGIMGTESGDLLIKNGYKQVFNLKGGMDAWIGELEAD
ncbi:sulfurtransferase [Paenibacillus sp. FSL A5-0031]|uniref:rhodanese-like domain-containing protein n=1 Tax=Paenibacillus sp. FSL A5-0031 TaxID=1920420 RepID=UPI00096BD77F|nr:rhodanese-like domain-containing protein [Paenibacillus sp. FSL A5-0031]OME78705.1 sulfurtransferase [Paenibacillus sp. FSL A5-0031]